MNSDNNEDVDEDEDISDIELDLPISVSMSSVKETPDSEKEIMSPGAKARAVSPKSRPPFEWLGSELMFRTMLDYLLPLCTCRISIHLPTSSSTRCHSRLCEG
jgi:hypothetical protein